MDNQLPESGRLEGFAHPRDVDVLYGQDEAQERLLGAYKTGRMHHAWILGGEQGIGKATLAYRMARFVFQNPDPEKIPDETSDLYVAPDAPVFRRVSSQGHSDLLVLSRSYNQKLKKLRGEISAGEARETTRFFEKTSGEGGWRICIVDAADEMNLTAANAILKILEEPPARALFLLISSSPHKLLPTIRSRCCSLALDPLGNEDISRIMASQLSGSDMPGDKDMTALAKLAGGSAGKALSFASGGGAAIYREVFRIMKTLPALDMSAAHKLAGRLALRTAGAEFRMFLSMLEDWIASMVRANLTGEAPDIMGGEREIMRRIGPPSSLADWARLWEKLVSSQRQAKLLNLDRKQLVLDTLFSLEETSRHAR